MVGAIIAKKMAKSSFDAFNRGDLDKFIASWSEDATWTFPGNTPISGVTKGKKEIKAAHVKMMEIFPGIQLTVKEIFISNIFAMGSTNNIAVEYEITYTNQEGKEVHNSGVTIIKIKRGKAIEVKDYAFNI